MLKSVFMAAVLCSSLEARVLPGQTESGLTFDGLEQSAPAVAATTPDSVSLPQASTEYVPMERYLYMMKKLAERINELEMRLAGIEVENRNARLSGMFRQYIARRLGSAPTNFNCGSSSYSGSTKESSHECTFRVNERDYRWKFNMRNEYRELVGHEEVRR